MIMLDKKARIRALQNSYRRAEVAHPREQKPIDAIRNLGLLDKEEDTRTVLGNQK